MVFAKFLQGCSVLGNFFVDPFSPRNDPLVGTVRTLVFQKLNAGLEVTGVPGIVIIMDYDIFTFRTTDACIGRFLHALGLWMVQELQSLSVAIPKGVQY